MPLRQILFLVAVTLLLAYIGISSALRRRQRPFALAKARTILGSLRGKNDSLPRTPRIGQVQMLLAICNDADIALEELGTSSDELNDLCRNPRKRKVK